MSDLDQFNKIESKANPLSETKSINYYSIFENYQSNPVQRSSSLNSLKRYKNVRSSHKSDDERSIRSMTDGIEYKSQSQLELPLEVVNQLERYALHGNVRRDSFRSRSGTKNFVLNPIFDERDDEENDGGNDEVFNKNSEVVKHSETDTHESGLRLKPPNNVDDIETVFTDLKSLEDGKMTNIPNPLRRSKSLRSNKFSSLW